MKGDIKPRAQTIRIDPQLHSSTDPQTQHLSSWLFEHWSRAIRSTTHVSTILENPPFRTDEERNDNSRYRIPQALFSLTSSKTPLSLPVSHTSLIHRSSTLSQAVPLTYTDFYLVSTSIPNPIYPFPPELGKSPNALVSGCFLNTCSISYLSHLRINEPTTGCNEPPSRTSAFPPPFPFPKTLPPLPPPYSSKTLQPTETPPPPFLRSKAQNQDPPATTMNPRT